MKRILPAILSALLLTVALLTVVGCDVPEDPFHETTEEPTETGEIQCPVLEETLSAEDVALVEIAAEALWAEYDLPGREHYRADVSHRSDGRACVTFTLYIGEYRTMENYDVNFSADGAVTDILNTYYEYRQFLPNATAEAIAAAEEAIRAQLEPYGETEMAGYLTVDDEGYLCLSCEVIVDLDPPFWEQEGGCGIDHDHLFFNERICAVP